MFQAPPPPPPPPPEVLRTDSLNLSIAAEDRPVLFVKAQQTERGLVRYQLFQRVELQATRAPQAAGDPAPPPPILCNWIVSVWLQRDPCVESVTGRLACMQGYNVRLEDRERGSEAVAEPAACTPDHPAPAGGSARLAKALTGSAGALFDVDLKRRFAPELSYAGVTLRPRTR